MTSFEEIGVQENVILGLEKLGFETPTPVQESVIPRMLEKRGDMISLAQTGTGKTAAFGIPLIQLLNTQSKETQALVLCPTRELCIQVAKDVQAYAKYIPAVRVEAVYGGTSIEQQIRALKRGVHIVVATPGRLNDLLRRRKVDLSNIFSAVLDEADEMLQMGFLDDLNAILSQTPKEKSTLLFSATMSKPVALIARKYMKDPEEITIGQRNRGTENVQHQYCMAKVRDRYPALKRIVDFNSDIYGIIFCRTRQETKDIADKLIQDGYAADALHGDLSQAQRDQVMKRFRKKSLQILVATDVAARGLDVNDLTHVINYNLPDDAANYTHRSGRTGRAGKQGISMAIIQPRETFKIKDIERRLGRKFECIQIPSGDEICQKQLFGLAENISAHQVDYAKINPFFEEIEQKFASLDRDDLIKRLLSLELNRLLEYYQYAPDLNTTAEKSRKTQKTIPGKRISNQKFTRFFLNVGKNDGIIPQRLLGELNDVPGTPRIRVGRIEIMKSSATLEADSRYVPQVLNAFQHLMINGKPVSIKVAAGKQQEDKISEKGYKRKKTRKSAPKNYRRA